MIHCIPLHVQSSCQFRWLFNAHAKKKKKVTQFKLSEADNQMHNFKILKIIHTVSEPNPFPEKRKSNSPTYNRCTKLRRLIRLKSFPGTRTYLVATKVMHAQRRKWIYPHPKNTECIGFFEVKQEKRMQIWFNAKQPQQI